MTSFQSTPVKQATPEPTAPSLNVLHTLCALWEQLGDWEQDLTVYCQSSPHRLAIATGATLALLCLTLWLFMRLRLF